MTIAEHIKEHIVLGLDGRFPSEGNTYFKFSATKVELYVEGVLAVTWTKPDA
jgi:hypothetical protein